MRLNPDKLYARVLAGDPGDDGRFFFGVTTTGVYCLPSCKARKPRRENTRFFPDVAAARAFGLRACKKCHPDDFARGADPVLESIEQLVSEIRTHPAAFADARAVVKRSGFGPTRLFELFRRHYHATPADLLLRARLASVKILLLSTDDSPADIAFAAGFRSLSVFHAHFRAFNGLTPLAFRELRSTRAFAVALPKGYPLAHLKRSLGRDPHSLTERLEGNAYSAVVRLGLDQTPALLRIHLSPEEVRVETSGPAPKAHAAVVGLLGLDQDAAAFVRHSRELGFARLVAKREQLRLPQTPSVFDGLVWAIIGQQINLPFAFQLRRRLTQLVSPAPFADGLHAPPSPADLATLSPDSLRPLQFSRTKADYLIATAKLVADGALDLDALRTMSATRAERTLLAIRGLGPWSVNYLMMRSLGFADCLPLGDTGVTAGLRKLHRLTARPDLAAIRRLMSVFSPHRSLATAHLWQLNQDAPA